MVLSSSSGSEVQLRVTGVTMSSGYEAWFDGACEPRNPGGHATYGFVIYRDKKLVDSGFGHVGSGSEMTNNVAEYSGAIAVMSWFLGRGMEKEEILVRGDSMLVIRQMGKNLDKTYGRGKYVPFREVAKVLRRKFERMTFEWTPREKNEEADKMSREWWKGEKR